MNTKPILFSGEMVRQILAGNRTQTRRLVEDPPPHDCGRIEVGYYHPVAYDRHGEMYPGDEVYGAYSDCGEWGLKSPYGQPGDLLWVRETWASHSYMDDTKPSEFTAGAQMLPVWYRADGEQGNTERGRWRPSIHMPRWASRITLCVTDVRVEQLWEMSVYKMEAEGVSETEDGNRTGCSQNHPLTPFIRLWNGINGKRPGVSWEDNPWVWVVEFERVGR